MREEKDKTIFEIKNKLQNAQGRMDLSENPKRHIEERGKNK